MLKCYSCWGYVRHIYTKGAAHIIKWSFHSFFDVFFLLVYTDCGPLFVVWAAPSAAVSAEMGTGTPIFFFSWLSVVSIKRVRIHHTTLTNREHTENRCANREYGTSVYTQWRNVTFWLDCKWFTVGFAQ